ncbi:MAG: hypothetical protein GEV07_14750 [Streptosporangiales bacterium]|nr:hypothetical protein [Streptosporangiales bacterium]
MLTAADRELVTREPAIPGLRVALDPDALLELFLPQWPAGQPQPQSAHVRYVRYKPGTSLLAGVELRTATESARAFVKAYGRGGEAKVAKLRANGDADPVGWGALVDDELNLVFADATADRALPGLRRLTTTADGRLQPLRYKPERRWVGRHHQAAGVVRLVKVHRPRTTAGYLAAQHALTAAGLPVPALHSADSETGVLTYDWFDGTPLDQLAPTADQLHEAGALLARLHRAAGPVQGRPPNPTADVGAAVEAIAAIAPRCATVAQSAVLSALHARRALEPVTTTVHGDFSADQLIARPTGLGLVDLDRVRTDDPVTDLATWVAAELAGGRAPADAEPADVLGPLLTGYLAGTDLAVHRRLAVATTLALLHRAVEPFRHRAPDWLPQTEALVHAADRMAHASQHRRVRA